MVDAFRICDDLLRQGVQGICDLITLPGIINLDFADVRTIVRGAGSALLGIGYAGGGNRAADAAQAAITSPLLETPIDGARGILLGVTGGPDLSLVEVSEAARVVQEAADPEANIIFGATIDPHLEGQVWVTVVATSFSGHRAVEGSGADDAPAPPGRRGPGRAPGGPRRSLRSARRHPPPTPTSACTNRPSRRTSRPSGPATAADRTCASCPARTTGLPSGRPVPRAGGDAASTCRYRAPTGTGRPDSPPWAR